MGFNKDVTERCMVTSQRGRMHICTAVLISDSGRATQMERDLVWNTFHFISIIHTLSV